jgi:hypothetical protein
VEDKLMEIEDELSHALDREIQMLRERSENEEIIQFLNDEIRELRYV